MGKFFRSLLIIFCLFLATILALLLFLQSEFAKDKVRRALEGMALQQGARLKIGAIEGDLPLKWTLKDVHLELGSSDSLDVDLLRLRISLLPLFRGKIGISYLNGHEVVYQYLPGSSASKIAPPALFIRSLKIEKFHFINRLNGKEGIYTISGSCQFKSQLRTFDVHTKIQSSDLEGELFLQGSQKSDEISGNLSLQAKTDQALLPFLELAHPLPFKLEMTGSGSLSHLRPFQGEVTLHLPTYQHSLLTSYFSFDSDRSLKLNSLILKSDTLLASGNASFDAQFFPTALDLSFQAQDLSRWLPDLKGAAQGKIDFSSSHAHAMIKSSHLSLFSNAAVEIQATLEQNQWIGKIQGSASHPELGFQASADFRLNYPNFELQKISLEGPQGFLSGDAAVDLSNWTTLEGGIAFQIKALTPFTEFVQTPLAGSLAGSINFQKENIRSHLVGKGLKVGPLLSEESHIDLLATDFLKEIKGHLRIDLQHAYLADVFFQSASYSMGWNDPDWSYKLKTEGDWKYPFHLTSEGHLAGGPGTLRFICDKLSGSVLQKTLSLDEPFQFSFQNENLLLTNFKLKISEGFCHSALQVTPEASRIYVQAEHFPLDFLTLFSSRLSLQGLATLDVDLAGSASDLAGHVNLLLEQAEILPAGSLSPIQAKASLQANLSHNTLQLHSHLLASQEQFVDLSLTLPLSYHLSRFQLSIDPTKTVAGECTIEGHVEQLFDFINIGSQRLGGFLSSRLILSGSLDRPSLFGPITIQGGFYQNDFIGLSLKNGNLEGSATGQQLAIPLIQVQDGNAGTCTASAQFDIKFNLPFHVQGTLHNFQVVDFDWLSGQCSGPFSISGNLEKGVVAGTLAIDQAEIFIPDRLPTEVPSLPVTFINQPPSFTPPSPPEPSYPFHYDLKIHGEHDTRLLGRGLDAELAGDLHLTGKNLDLIANGTLHTIKGIFSFAGKDFKITTGDVIFSEKGNFINIAANLEIPDLIVTVLFRGTLRSPQLIFQSNPPLPTSTILARILFDKDVSELSASQIVQLATTVMTLSSSSNLDILGTIRRNLGIDRLSISANEKGEYSVEIGKSISTEVVKGVAATLSQDTENSHIKVEVELKGGFILGAETQEDDQGKFSFKWNKNY